MGPARGVLSDSGLKPPGAPMNTELLLDAVLDRKGALLTGGQKSIGRAKIRNLTNATSCHGQVAALN
jgi:hypothetical protein